MRKRKQSRGLEIEEDLDLARKVSRIRPSGKRVVDRKKKWTIGDSSKLYKVKDWGAPYFSINDKGHMQVDPATNHKEKDKDGLLPIDLFELVEDVIQRGHNLPLLIRFSDILKDRIRILNTTFHDVIAENKYNGEFMGVFPIKVCQQRRVVKEVVEFGKPYKYGLDAASKPELLVVLSHLKTKGAMITCNGYKDIEYIETALLAQQMGQLPIIIVEKLHELELVLHAAKKLSIRPNLGVRAKLSMRGVARFCLASGDHAKFGLSAADIMEVVRVLRAEKMLDCLQMLQFHLGSQVTRISVVKDALRESTMFFVQLYKLGATQMKYFNVGGGIGVDYDGSKSSAPSSVNYTLREYAADVVEAIKVACDKESVPHPTIVSESGRTVISHQTVLVFSVLGATTPMSANTAPCHPLRSPTHPTSSTSSTSPTNANGSGNILSAINGNGNDFVPMEEGDKKGCDANAKCCTDVKLRPLMKPDPNEHSLIQNLYEIWTQIRTKNLQEIYHDATQYKSEALTLFTLGLLSLAERAKVEDMFWHICMEILPLSKNLKYIPEELQELEKMMSYIYYCNLSVFQSAPDCWASEQLFPIMPLHRLEEKPTSLATLADITCDSDGKIDKFISDQSEPKDLLELHPLDEEHPYYLGMFLSGAYQEVRGNLHNLFGDTNVIHVELDPEDETGVGYSVEHVVRGDTTNQVLEYMQYNPKMMLEDIRLQSEMALNQKKLTLPQYRLLVKHYEKALTKYTYLWADED